MRRTRFQNLYTLVMLMMSNTFYIFKKEPPCLFKRILCNPAGESSTATPTRVCSMESSSPPNLINLGGWCISPMGKQLSLAILRRSQLSRRKGGTAPGWFGFMGWMVGGVKQAMMRGGNFLTLNRRRLYLIQHVLLRKG